MLHAVAHIAVGEETVAIEILEEVEAGRGHPCHRFHYIFHHTLLPIATHPLCYLRSPHLCHIGCSISSIMA
jgi:hypothetical protein